LEDDLKALIKPQYVDQIPKAVKGTVQQLLDKKDERKNQNEICQLLGKPVWSMQALCSFIEHVSSWACVY
jgi:translation initiation factor RLI1